MPVDSRLSSIQPEDGIMLGDYQEVAAFADGGRTGKVQDPCYSREVVQAYEDMELRVDGIEWPHYRFLVDVKLGKPVDLLLFA